MSYTYKNTGPAFPDVPAIAIGAKLSGAVAHTKQQIPVHHDNCTVINMDPMSKGSATIPREVLVRLPGGDGAEHIATWNGNPPNIEVDSIVACRQDPGHMVLVIEGAGGSDQFRGGGAWPADDKVNIDSTQFGSIEAAITASSSGDVFKLGPGTFTISASITITGRTFIGTGRGVTIISTTTQDVNLDGATLQNLTITRAGTSANDDTVQVSGSTGFTIQNCEILATGGGGRCVYSNAGTVMIENSDLLSTGAGSTRGIWTDSGATLTIRGGRVQGGSQDVYVNGGTVYLEGAELVSGLLQGTFATCSYIYNGRVFGEGASYTYPTTHFRGAAIPSGYAWAGSPFATPGTIAYNYLGDWMRGYHAGTARGFLYKSASTALLNQFIYLSGDVDNNSDYGLRIDDGTDTNYCEFRVVHTAGASYQLRLIQAGTPSGTTNVTMYASDKPITLMFLLSGSSLNWTPLCYITNRLSSNINVIVGSLNTTWNPAQKGICLDNTGAALIDWAYIP